MLTQRTNILLSPDEYGLLLALSKEHNKTMGELIRHAVKKAYGTKIKDSFEASLKRIRKITRHVDTKNINYRELAIEGRRYED
ncbi:MAG: hypothetical protein V1487_03110 [bacterium]